MLWPEGRQSRLDTLERRVQQHDVDIMRLWRAAAVVQAKGPKFDGEPVEIVETASTLWVAAGLSQTSVDGSSGVASLRAALASALSVTSSLDAIGSSSGFPAEFDLNQYQLIILHFAAAAIPVPAEFAAANVLAWLDADKQRRFVCGFYAPISGGGNTNINNYWSSLGVASSSVFPATYVPISGTGIPTGHYLAAGQSYEAASAGKLTGGTMMFAVPDTDEGTRDIMSISTVASGAEIITAVDSQFVDPVGTNNTFTVSLHPAITPVP